MDFLNYIVGNKLILIPVLYIIGYIIKSTNTIRNKFIPLILLAVGIILAVLMGGDTIINNIVQGILVTGATVMTDQMIRQSTKND
ncbi:MAG: phage holin family protein [Bacilli bacterium]|nr:phage holin family protein [Bacilli bacterium]